MRSSNLVVLEDSGANSVTAFATFSPGPANEAAQTLIAYTLSNTSNALFSAQPAIDNLGRLTFTPATNANGSATVTVVAHDNGGTVNGGVDKTTNTFTITVTPVNDAPSFTKGSDQVVLANAGAQTVPAWATAISAGPANESAQLLNFLVTNTSNSLFSAQPALAPNGTLTFTPATNALGTATVTVRLHDDGGTLNGGVDTSAPQTFTITITQPPGHTFWAMGDNRFGQLGDGTTLPNPPFGRPSPVRILSDIAAAAAGGDAEFGHSLFVKRDGTLLTVGANHVGQLGDGTTINRSNPVQVATAVATPAAGALHSLFIKRDDTLWTMGGNAFGQLGDGTLNNRSNPVLVATAVATAAGGGGHSLFVKRDSTLWAMGGNASGQLGDGTTEPRPTPVPIVSGVNLASAGEAHSLFVKTDGTLWAMGRNVEGQLGDGSNLQRNAPVLVTSGVTAAAAGSAHSLFIKTDGTLWAMGYNGRGQLGVGTTDDHNTPVFVTNGVVAVAAGDDHSLFVKGDGTLWAMGWNAFGQLGDGTFIDRHTPVLIPVDPGASLAAPASLAPAVPVMVVVPAAGGSHSLFLGDAPIPELLCPTNLVVRNDAGVCGARVTFAPTVRNGAGTFLVCVPASGSFFPVGTNPVTCTLLAGSPAVPVAVCGFTVTVTDSEAPRFLVRPADRQVESGQSTEPDATGRPTATDNCTTAPRISYVDLVIPGGTAPVIRTIKRTWTATDAVGNTASFVQTITVISTARLVIHCPPDLTIQCGAGITSDKTGKATATTVAGCGPVTLTFKDTSGNQVPPVVKVITRTWTATDTCGNRVTCPQIITVVDTNAPKILSLTATPARLSPANNKMVPVKVKRVVEDSCTPNAKVTSTLAVKVTDPAGLDGKTYFVVKSLDEITLRAKKGVSYKLTLTCRDQFGNTATKAITVPVK